MYGIFQVFYWCYTGQLNGMHQSIHVAPFALIHDLAACIKPEFINVPVSVTVIESVVESMCRCD